jgi:hypothetical protein
VVELAVQELVNTGFASRATGFSKIFAMERDMDFFFVSPGVKEGLCSCRFLCLFFLKYGYQGLLFGVRSIQSE